MTAYADRYGAGPKFKPGSMGLALALTVLPVAGLIVSLQVTQILRAPTKGTTLIDLKDPPPPPPPDPIIKKVEKLPPTEKVYVPPVAPSLPFTPPPIDTTPIRSMDPPSPIQPGTGTVPIQPVVVPIPKPVMVNALYDPRFNSALQPPYPAEEIRAGREGRVELKVLIGTDGRVKDVVKISAASEAFFLSAQRQAMSKWRFKPATSDGVPIEQWKVMTLRFKLDTSE